MDILHCVSCYWEGGLDVVISGLVFTPEPVHSLRCPRCGHPIIKLLSVSDNMPMPLFLLVSRVEEGFYSIDKSDQYATLKEHKLYTTLKEHTDTQFEEDLFLYIKGVLPNCTRGQFDMMLEFSYQFSESRLDTILFLIKLINVVLVFTNGR